MPNWCVDELIVTGPVADVQKFMEDVKTEEDGKELLLSFNKLVPVPDEIRDPDPMILSDAQYNWSVENWGTKWDLCGGDVRLDTFEMGELDHLQANYAFMTAWSPCSAWVKQISPMYPTLTFDLEYAEDGMDFQGRLIICNGEIAEEYQEKFDPKRWGFGEEDEEEDEDDEEDFGVGIRD